MITVDTNVLARAFANDDPEQGTIARAFLAELKPAAPGFVSLTVLVELYWVLRRSLRFSVVDVNSFLDALMRAPVFEIEDGESVGEALEATRNGADFADSLLDATSRLYGTTETVTFDQDAARRFGWRLLA